MPLSHVDAEASRQLGEIVRGARQRKQLSVSDAARKAGIGRRTWHEVETGARVRVTPTSLAAMEPVIGLPEGTLMATVGRSVDAELETLRSQAIDIIRLWSRDELGEFVDTNGRDTLVTMLRDALSQVEAKRDASHRPSGTSGRHAGRSPANST